MSESEPEPLPGEGEAAAAPRPQVIESIVEYKARQLAVLKKIAKEQELDEDSMEYKEFLQDIDNNIELMRIKLRSELDALKNPKRKPVARRARGSAGAPVCSARLLCCCCLTLPDAHAAKLLCRCLPAPVK